ncbi:hypothetical protein CAEBREN_22505 [Caenorhabditis brenneri]|uniref:Uncharacterized protein n=1 Tax=Caenorhabditis brenneri TaxID=135651 RepID=G0NI81_CAEBE|nr:hypothetical protein CAEBREN_22505 [Caenorhabditis brenneri]
MSYVFRLLAFPISPYLQRGINKIDRRKAPKTIEKLLADLVKTVVAMENRQSYQNSGRPDVTAPGTLPEGVKTPESVQDDIEMITIDSSEDEEAPEDVQRQLVDSILNFELLDQDELEGYDPEDLLKNVQRSEEMAGVLSDHEVEEENPEDVTSPAGSALLESPVVLVEDSEAVGAPEVSEDVRMILEYLVDEVGKFESESSGSKDPGSAPPQDLDFSSLPPKLATSCDSRDPSPDEEEVPKIDSRAPEDLSTPTKPSALSISSSEDSDGGRSTPPQDSDSDDSSDDGCAKKLTSSGSAPPQDSDSDDSSEGRPQGYSYASDNEEPLPKRRRHISDSSESDNEVARKIAPAALPASSRPVMTPEPMDPMEIPTINVSQTINLSILLNQDTPASTPIPSPDSAYYPPSMKKLRAINCYEHIVSMCEFMKTELSSVEIEVLQQDLKSRNRLYERYVEEGRLQATTPNSNSRQEHLPIYVFLMAPKTKESYLDGFKNDEIPINATFHEHIFKASMKHDENTVELLQIYFISRATKSMKGKWVDKCARAIAEGKEFRVEEDVIGVIKVESLEKVPDGSCLVCFEKMPPISSLQSKSLNCVVMNPSDQDLISILQQPGIKVSVNLEGLSIGKRGIPVCKCFGPKVLAPTVIPKCFDNLASLFHRILYNKKGHSMENIYVVEGFW